MASENDDSAQDPRPPWAIEGGATAEEWRAFETLLLAQGRDGFAPQPPALPPERDSERKSKPEFRERWASFEEKAAAIEAWHRGVDALITRGRGPDEWSEVERAGWSIAEKLCTCFLGAPGSAVLRRLHLAEQGMKGTLTEQARRALAVDAVCYWATRQTEDETGTAEHGPDLIQELVRLDGAFECLRGEDANVTSLLRLFALSSAGHKGEAGGEKILARLIVDYCDANGVLGLAAKDGESDEAAVERIRKRLDKAVRLTQGRS